MSNDKAAFSTGLPGLDNVLKEVMPGDSFVWQVGSVDNYKPFVGLEWKIKRKSILSFPRTVTTD